MYQFRDPIHGFISVSEEEKSIIDSKPFQRLRNIKQLATTNLVYHGAEHTRFGHSIGVMHLVSKTFDAVVEKNPNLFSKNKKENDTICQYYRQILRLIALTHDLGHAPFSHASEELFPNKKRHEDYTKDIIFNTEIGYRKRRNTGPRGVYSCAIFYVYSGLLSQDKKVFRQTINKSIKGSTS